MLTVVQLFNNCWFNNLLNGRLVDCQLVGRVSSMLDVLIVQGWLLKCTKTVMSRRPGVKTQPHHCESLIWQPRINIYSIDCNVKTNNCNHQGQ